MPNVEAVIAKYNAEAATAEPVSDLSSAPPAEGSEAGSAVADAAVAGVTPGVPASPTAPIDHEELQAKLSADRQRTHAKKLRRQARADAEAAAKTKADADAELAKWKAIGKDQSFLEAIKAAGHNPAEVYEQMRKEALTAGTPEARIEALEKKFTAENEALRAELKKRDEADAERARKAEEEQKQNAARAESEAFLGDFRRALTIEKYKPLTDEYDPAQLFALANKLKSAPKYFFDTAKSLGVALTGEPGTFTMQDIFNVMHASQAAHVARLQRRNQSAAPHASEAPVTQGHEANPTVNGTAERKAESPTTLGNHIATSTASVKSEKELRATMTRDEWRAYVRKKHENAKL